MKAGKKLILLAGLSLLLPGVYAQGVEVAADGSQTFEFKEADTTYLMKQYFMVFLKAGPERSHDQEEAARIQREHLAHIKWMAEEGYVDMAGPFGDEGEIRGILVMHVPNRERAEELAAMDPAVKSGRLLMEIHPWWAAVGSCLK